jgi:hypothetical protein
MEKEPLEAGSSYPGSTMRLVVEFQWFCALKNWVVAE